MKWTKLAQSILIVVGVAMETGVPDGPGIAAAKALASDDRVLTPWEDKYGRDPVNARVDRVWKAIPGLSGWTLDVAATKRQMANGHMSSLVWQPVPPSKRLSDLPAQPIYRGPKEERAVSLMFNVSWGEQYVSSILKTLSEKHVHATFFLDGAWVRRNPELARKIVAGGHAIGSHGSGHPDFKGLTEAALRRQVIGTNSTLAKYLQVKCRLLAPPSGSYDMRTVKVAREQGVYTILWTVDTVDWKRPAPDVIVSRVLTSVSPGSLILMHPTLPTVQALPGMIEQLTGKGYRFKTVEEVVDEKSVFPPPRRA